MGKGKSTKKKKKETTAPAFTCTNATLSIQLDKEQVDTLIKHGLINPQPGAPGDPWREVTGLALVPGTSINQLTSYLGSRPPEKLAAALIDIIRFLKYDEDDFVELDEPRSGADFIDSVQHTLKHVLNITE